LEGILSTDAKGTKILARTFFNQLRSSGYTPHQIIAVATELIELVTCDLRDGQAEAVPPTAETTGSETRPNV
jgi:hypothetical protein